MKLSEKQIEHIAQELDSGMKCYINKETGEVKSIWDIDDMDGDTELWEEELEEIEKNWKDYETLEKMSSREAYQVMEDFIETVSEKKIKNRLIHSLNGRRPFSSFKNEVDYNGGIREKWFAFKDKEYREYVRLSLEDEFELEKEKTSEDEMNSTISSINFKGKTFRLISNSEEGIVDEETIFEYEQEGDLITADYQGGGIRYGKIIGALKGDKINMLYQCMTNENELKAGKAIAQITLDSEGKIRMSLNWEWLDKEGEQGISEYIED